MELHSFLLVASALINVLLGIYIFIKTPKGNPINLLCFFLFAFAFWGGLDFLIFTERGGGSLRWESLRLVGVLVTFTLLLHYMIAFSRSNIIKRKILLYLPIVPIALFGVFSDLIIKSITKGVWGYQLDQGVFFPSVSIYILFLLFISVLFVVKYYFPSTQNNCKNCNKCRWFQKVHMACIQPIAIIIPMLLGAVTEGILPLAGVTTLPLLTMLATPLSVIVVYSVFKCSFVKNISIAPTKIKSKIITPVMLLTITVLSSLGFIIYVFFQKFLEEDVITHFSVAIESRKKRVNAFLEEQREHINLMSKDHHFLDMLIELSGRESFSEEDWSNKEDHYQDVINIFKEEDFLEVFVLDFKGTVVLSTNPANVGKDHSREKYFKEGLNGSYLANEVIQANNGYVVPITGRIQYKENNNEVLGIIVALTAKSRLDSILADRTGLGRTGEAYLLNENNYRLTPLRSSKEGEYLKQVVDNQSTKDCFSMRTHPEQHIGHKQVIKGKNFQGERVFIAHAYIPEVDWCLITELSENEAFLLPNKLLQLIVFVGIIAIVVSFLMISWISKKITDPIEALRLGAKRIEEGDMSHKVGTRDKDEIGQLSRAFDLMTTAIRNSWLEVDEKVKEQTSSITHQKEKLETQQRAILNILEDVEKEKKVSENLATDLEKFRLAVESSGDLMVITDPDGIILYANDATERITKFKIKDVLGKKAGTSSLWGGNMSEKYYKKLWKVIKEKKKPFIGELKNKRKDGEEYDVDVQISPILNKEGGVEFFVSVERDITKAKDVDRMKTEFVSLASHQLRTPLSAINWYTEMLLTGDAGELNKIQAQYLKEVYNGNQRMVRLVESLLNVSRMELGTFVVEPEDLNLKEIIESALHELESKINEKKLIIKLVYDKKIPLIKADPKLLHIIFQNLLSNAVKYTPEKGKVKCTLKKDKKNILIEISDTGYGIPKNQEDKIFSKLFRADNVRVKNVEGNGLGLYLVKAIVEEAKGKIWFKSKENKGTTFFVVMPLSGMKKKTGTRRLS